MPNKELAQLAYPWRVADFPAHGDHIFTCSFTCSRRFVFSESKTPTSWLPEGFCRPSPLQATFKFDSDSVFVGTSAQLHLLGRHVAPSSKSATPNGHRIPIPL
jgi:hypothetical protein